MPLDSDFFHYQEIVNCDINCVPSHNVICKIINKCSMDYRFEKAPNPIPCLRDRCNDNVTLGRVPDKEEN